jgi:hypothetical protein
MVKTGCVILLWRRHDNHANHKVLHCITMWTFHYHSASTNVIVAISVKCCLNEPKFLADFKVMVLMLSSQMLLQNFED